MTEPLTSERLVEIRALADGETLFVTLRTADLRAFLAAADAAAAEVDRLRKRTHELQERHDKALAPLRKDLAYLRNLMIEATHHYRDQQPELHRLKVEELIARCSEDFKARINRYPLSPYDRATLAVLLGHNEHVEADLAAARADLETSTRIRADLAHGFDNVNGMLTRRCIELAEARAEAERLRNVLSEAEPIVKHQRDVHGSGIAGSVARKIETALAGAPAPSDGGAEEEVG